MIDGLTFGGKMTASPELIEQLIKEAKSYRPEEPVTRFYKWVPDGVYDCVKDKCRHFIHDGFSYFTASKMWIENPNQNHRLPDWMKLPWLAYPDFPPKQK